ncbi:MAG: InlB B-repeat-containing protein [Pseudobutyrivibrio sp.]|uniref:InlB B-repeat-containing protein n=1 Tax=Pseudobutyrivibrio sp. TaxID=2014367 RepID=UPI0025D8137A|nr:InlB B-repeat-containing protein [Pseudobutyrivibrio sp.]MBQ6462324.1 InlB B-repeat-containing protein [Pseudobutyrivibrio sp.]
MHIKRLLSGSLAAMMVATSFNVPINVKAAEVPDTEPAAGLEENQELPSSDAEIPVDDDTNVVVEEPAVEPEVVTPEAEVEAPVEETTEETPAEELVVEEETAEQEVVGDAPTQITVTVSFADGVEGEEITVPDAKTVTANVTDATATGTLDLSEVTAPVRSGYAFAGWKVGDTDEVLTSDETYTYTKTGVGEETAATDSVTLTAQWTAKTSISSYTVEVGELVYDGTAKVPEVTVKNGEEPVDPENYDIAVYDKATVQENETALGENKVEDAGDYHVIVTAKDSSNYTGKTEAVSFKVEKKELTVQLGKDGSNNPIEAGKYALYFQPHEGLEAGVIDKAPIAQQIKPVVSFDGLVGEETLTANAGETKNDYSVTYGNNNAAGKDAGTVTVAFEDESTVAKNYKLKESIVKFTIEDKNDFDNLSTTEGKHKTTKSKVEKKDDGTYSATAGLIEGYDDTYGGYVSKAIPAVNLSSIKVKGDRSKKTVVGVAALSVFDIYDAEGAKLTKDGDYEVAAVALKEDGATETTTPEEFAKYKITVTFKGNYDGTYEIIDDFAEANETDTFTRHIIPATFDHAGLVYWSKATGAEAGDGATVKIDGKDVVLSNDIENLWKANYVGTIPQLNKEFTINDYVAEEGFDYEGEKVEPTVALQDLTPRTIPESVTTGEGDSAVTTTYYELKYEGNDKPNNAAKVTVVMKNELYEGSASKTFKIVEAKETLVAPKVRGLDGSSPYNLYYGDKIQLVSPTKDAKIYYSLSDSTGAITALEVGNYATAGTLYRDTIELKEANAEIDTSGDYDRIQISAIIVKEGCDPAVMETYDLYVHNKWGDVKEYDITDYNDIPQNGLWISDYSMSHICDKGNNSPNIVYSGKAKEIPIDELRVFFGTRLLTYKTDYTVKYANNVHASEYDAVKEPTITVVGKGRYAGGFIQPFDIEQQNITPLTTPNTYDELTLAENSKIQTPKITAYDLVWNGSKNVKKNFVANKDYTVSYYDWKDSNGDDELDEGAPEITATAGTKVAEVVMQGDYTGRAYVKYEVAAADKYLNKAKVTIDSSAVVFDGNNQANNVVTTVKVNDVELVRGTDYEVEFKELAQPYPYFVTENLLTAGKYVVKIVPKTGSLYKGYKEVNYTFKGGIDITKAANVRIEGTEKKVEWVPFANGKGTRFSNLKLTETARIDGAEKPMYEGTDYIAIYSTDTNNAVGKATLTLIGRGKYTGTKKITFEVTPKYTLNKNDVTVKSLVYDYAGHNDIDDLSNDMIYIKDGSGLDGDGVVLDSDITFAESAKDDFENSTDKVKVYYATKDMTNAGTKKLTIEGNPAQGYKGKVTVNFTIEPFDLDADQKKVDKDTPANSTNVVDFEAYGYAGKINPGVKWYFDRSSYDWKYLSTKEINNNFTVKYSTKKFNAGTEGTATFTPKAKKNFKGSPIQVSYKIVEAQLYKEGIVINDQGTNDKTTKFGKGVAPVVTFDGKKLKANTDYTVEYFYNVDAAGTHARFEKPAPTDIMKAGTIITCRITGKGNYDGTINVDYKYVLSANLATNAKLVQKTKKVYEGSPVTLKAGTDFDITLGTDTTKDAKGKTVKTPHVLTTEQYKVVSVTNNEKPGTAKVTIALSGEYGGTKTFNFKIDKKSMDYRVEFAVGSVPTGATVTGKTAAMTSKTSTFKSLPTSGFTVSKKEGKTTTKYAFAGWFTDTACTQAVDTPIGKAYEPDIAPGETKTLYAKYVTPSEYTITFDANGGTKAKDNAIVTQKIAIGAKKALQANPFVKTGYKFEGWDTESEGNNVVYKNKEQVVNVTTGTTAILKAVWSPITYKITYKNVDTKAETFYGPLDAAKVIADPTKAGYTFEGWKVEIKGQKAETGKKAYSIPKDTAADVTLTAAWKAKEVIINFTNAETLKDPSKFVASTKVDAGKKVTLPKLVAANEEKVFVGWKNGDTVYKGGTQQAFASDSAVALASVWADKKYTITYVLDGGKFVSSTYPTTFTKATAATTTLPNNTVLTKFGYTFTKWELVEGSKATELTDGKLPADTAKNVKVKPVWEENKSNLVITLKPGEGADANQLDQTVTIYPGGAANINNSFTRKNYDFAGWEATGLPEATYADKAVISNNGDGTAEKTATLTATWSKHNYIVKYDLNGATNTENASWLYDEGSRKTFVYKVGEPLTLETAPVRKGYTFVGWYNGTYDPSNPDTNKVTEIAVNTAEGAAAPKDVTVKAQWKAIDYTATLTLNGGKLADSIVATAAEAGKWVYDSAESPKEATQKYTINESVTLPTPVKENYTFDGWYTDSAFTKGNEITSIPVGTAENTTVYAKFTENKKVTITFDKGSETATGTMTAQVIYSGKSANLTDNTFTREGYTFAGWKVTSIDGEAVTGKADEYADKASFNAGTLTADKAVTLTAQWTAVTP